VSAGAPTSAMLEPVTLEADDHDWLHSFLAVPSVTPLEGGDLRGIERAQRIFVDGAISRGFALLMLEAPSAEEIVGTSIPETVRARLREPGFLETQPTAVVGLGRPQPEARRVVINFHVDTVGPHIPPRWDGEQIRGRGALDDKGPGIAAAIGVAAAFAARPEIAEEVEVLLAAVPGEEGGAMGFYGTRWLLSRGIAGRLMVFAEPTGNFTHDAATATMTARIGVAGEDSTDDDPESGHNATVALALIVDLLARELLPSAERLGAKVCIAGAHTGELHNRVYGSGRVLVNIGYDSAVQARALQACVESVVANAAQEVCRRYNGVRALARLVEDWSSVVELDWIKRDLPVLVNRDPPIEALLGRSGMPRRDALAEGVAFTCDAIWAGAPERYTAVCGPGTLSGGGAHTSDEHIAIADLDRYATSIRDMVLSFTDHCCATDEGWA
jgi:acetylornithine deacetylase/succinyl-diaminopimelate desuccinylase-like protein